MADNLNKEDLDVLISILRWDYEGAKYAEELIYKLILLRDTYDLYPDVWVSTVMLVGNEVVERRADVWHVSSEVFDEIAGNGKDDND